MNVPADPDEVAAAAGEHVLGTLDDADRMAFEAALADDPALRAEVYAWQDRLLGLSACAPAVAPSGQLWQRIELTLDAMAAGTPTPPHAAHIGRAPWWHSLGWWRGISAAAVAASLVMGVLLTTRLGMPEPSGTRYLAMLQSPTDQSIGWVVELQAGRSLRLVPVGGEIAVPSGRALQFWTKPQGAAGPTSLGLVRAGQPLELPLAVLPAAEAQQLFEITLEPENGSPIGRPTGPILYVGRTVKL